MSEKIEKKIKSKKVKGLWTVKVTGPEGSKTKSLKTILDQALRLGLSHLIEEPTLLEESKLRELLPEVSMISSTVKLEEGSVSVAATNGTPAEEPTPAA